MDQQTAYVDLELFTRISQDDVTAFAEIFHKYTARLYPTVVGIVRSEAEAEEIIQETFLKLWLHRRQLSEVSNPGGWLRTIAANLALSSLRRKARESRRNQLVVAEQSMTMESPEAGIDGKMVREAIAEAVQQLPEGRRQVFLLSRNEGLSRREIAEKLGISESTVKNQLSAALKFVQEFLDHRKGFDIPVYILLIILLKKI